MGAMGASAAVAAHVKSVTRPDITGDVEAIAGCGKKDGKPQTYSAAAMEEDKETTLEPPAKHEETAETSAKGDGH